MLPFVLAISSAFHRHAPSRTSPIVALASGYYRQEGDTGSVDEARVEALLEERNALRKDRNWNAADRLRDKIYSQFGVTIQDNEKIWHTSPASESFTSHGRRGYDRGSGGYSNDYDRGGGFNEDGRLRRRDRDHRRMMARASPYRRASTCSADLSDADVVSIEEMVQRRLRKKLDRRFDEADALLAELGEMSVAVSDDAREWRADGQSFIYSYTRVGSASSLYGGSSASDVEAVIQKRGEAKVARDYDEADRLRARLEGMGVGVDDRRRTWWFDDGTGDEFDYDIGGGGYGGGGYESSGYERESGRGYGGREGGGGSRRPMPPGGGRSGYGRENGYSGYQDVGAYGGGGGRYGGGQYGGGGRYGGGGGRAREGGYESRGRGGGGGYRDAWGGGGGYASRGSGYDDSRYDGSRGGGFGRGRGRGGPPGGGGGGRGGGGRGRALHDYVRSQTDRFELTPSEAQEVDALLGRRLAAKKARDFDKADSLQMSLRGLGVEVDDKTRSWHVRPDLIDSSSVDGY